METHPHDLIHGYLDGQLSQEQLDRLNSWIKEKPENAVKFAELAHLHDRLRSVLHDRIPSIVSKSKVATNEVKTKPQRSRSAMVGGLAAMIAIVLIAVWALSPTPLNAATELDHLIASSSTVQDRTYIIRSLDDQPEIPEDRRPPVDGATLHVRNPDKYVLIRRFADGRKFLTGSDGEWNWAVPPLGPVHISKDPIRFRSPLPGHEHGIPFADLRSDLMRLREAYIVSTIEQTSNGLRGLRCEKRSPEYRGPKEVELWYNARSGVIQRMVFDKMPRGRGGPKSVAVELMEQRELGADFFRHESHHSPDRRIEEEN